MHRTEQVYPEMSPEDSRALAARDSIRAAFLNENHVMPGCYSPVDPDGDTYFSWQKCKCCGGLPGPRRDYNFAMEQEQGTFEAAICPDCEYALAYGPFPF